MAAAMDRATKALRLAQEILDLQARLEVARQNFALLFGPELSEAKPSPEGRGPSLPARVLTLMKDSPGKEMTASEISRHLGANPRMVRTALGRLKKDGKLQQKGRGVYIHP